MREQEATARLEQAKDEARVAAAQAQALADQKRRELEGLLLEANQARNEQGDELEMLRIQMDEKQDHARKVENMSEYQITKVSKSRDRVALEKEVCEKKM